MDQRRNLRTFYIILLTQTLSMIGSRISGLAVGFAIFAETGQATPLALVSFFGALPSVLATGVAGVLADRWDRRKIMILSDLGQAIATVFLLVSFASGSFELWHLYVATIVGSICGSFQYPAFSASVTLLVPDDQRDRVNTLQQLAGPLAGIIAPPVAGVIYALVGVVGSIAVDLMTFLVAVGVVMAVHIPRPAETSEGRALKQSFRTEILGGFQYMWARKPLFWLSIAASALNFLLGGTLALALPYLMARLADMPNPEAVTGLLLAVINIGGLVGGILISAWGGTKRRMYTVLPSIFITGLFLALFGVARTAPFLGFALFFMMFPLPAVNGMLMSILQTKVAPDVQGRVFSVLGMMSQVLTPIAYLLVGPLADQVFEPAVGGAGWSTVAPLVGSGAGAGMGLMYVFAGLLVIGVMMLTSSSYGIRNLETLLPDYVPQRADDDASVIVGELTPDGIAPVASGS